MNLRKDLEKLKNILKKPKYFLLSFSISLLSLAAYSLFNNASIIERYIIEGDVTLAFSLMPSISARYFQTLPATEIMLVVAISGLIGLNLTLAAFRLLELSELGRENAASITGAAIATFAPACTACAGAVVGLTGATSAVALIPFPGYSTRILALFLLAGSIVYTLQQIGLQACKI